MELVETAFWGIGFIIIIIGSGIGAYKYWKNSVRITTGPVSDLKLLGSIFCGCLGIGIVVLYIISAIFMSICEFIAEHWQWIVGIIGVIIILAIVAAYFGKKDETIEEESETITHGEEQSSQLKQESVTDDVVEKITSQPDQKSAGFCENCGEKLDGDEAFCGNCGKPIQ